MQEEIKGEYILIENGDMGKLIFMRRFWEYGKRMKIRKLFEAAGDRIENITSVQNGKK